MVDWNKVKEIIFTISGHCITGFATGFATALIEKGDITQEGLHFALIGGVLGMLRILVSELDNISKNKAVGGSKKNVQGNKPVKTYFGF